MPSRGHERLLILFGQTASLESMPGLTGNGLEAKSSDARGNYSAHEQREKPEQKMLRGMSKRQRKHELQR
jgi:hypothetical protein